MTNTCLLQLLTQSATHNKHAYKPYPSYITNQHFSQLERSKHPQNILRIFFSSSNLDEIRKWLRRKQQKSFHFQGRDIGQWALSFQSRYKPLVEWCHPYTYTLTLIDVARTICAIFNVTIKFIYLIIRAKITLLPSAMFDSFSLLYGALNATFEFPLKNQFTMPLHFLTGL